MNKKSRLLHQLVQISFSLIALVSVAFAQKGLDLTGDWVIQSSVGGQIPITVNCALIQKESAISGTCTPVMDNPEASEVNGSIEGDFAGWGYDVVFNGNPGRVDFVADTVSSDLLSGTLSLSGTEAPFEAIRK